MRRSLSLLFSLLLLTACHGDAPVAPRQEPPATQNASDRAQRYIIRLAAMAGEAGPEAGEAAPAGEAGAVAQARARRLEARARQLEEVADIVQRTGGAVDTTFPAVGVALARGLTPAGTAELSAHPAVGAVVRDRVIQWVPDPRDVRRYDGARPAVLEERRNPADAPLWDLQWNMQVIRAALAARVEEGDRRVDIAIIDSGIDPEHVELRGKVDRALSRSVLADATCPQDLRDFIDRNWHGTAVAGVITTNNLLIGGVIQEANLIAVKMFDCQGLGTFGDMFAAILYAAAVEADVINMSLGAEFPLPLDPGLRVLYEVTHDVVGVAVEAGALVVASAGNESLDLSPYPGSERGWIVLPAQAHPQVVVVAATAPIRGERRDRPASYTNFGNDVITVSAPGGDLTPDSDPFDQILGPCAATSVVLPFPCDHEDLILWGGTSAAAPHAAGVAALADATDEALLPGRRLRQILIRSAVSRRPRDFHGHGRVDAYRAVRR